MSLLIQQYKEFEPLANKIAALGLLKYFSQEGVALKKGNSYEKTELAYALKLDKKFLKFFNYTLEFLASTNYIRVSHGKIEFLFQNETLEKEFNHTIKKLENFPRFSSITQLLLHCLQHYKKALSGEIPAISVLYPGADLNFMTPTINLIEKLTDFPHKEKKTKEFLCQHLTDLPASLLEVGAGTGRLTWSIAPMLDAMNINYIFSDISRFFLLKAEEVAYQKNIHHMTFERFDITKKPEEQGFPIKKFDVILAVNVLHIAPNLTYAIDILKKLLKKNGALIIIEYTNIPTWMHMIWGLAEGWWHFEDNHRSSIPLMPGMQWQKLIQDVGFKNVTLSSENSLKELELTAIFAENNED